MSEEKYFNYYADIAFILKLVKKLILKKTCIIKVSIIKCNYI